MLKITILVYNTLKIIIYTNSKKLENKYAVCQLCRIWILVLRRQQYTLCGASHRPFMESSEFVTFFIKTGYDFSVEDSECRWNKILADSSKF